MIRRNRILRQNDSIRKMVTETFLHPADFILPVFIEEGKGIKDQSLLCRIISGFRLMSPSRN